RCSRPRSSSSGSGGRSGDSSGSEGSRDGFPGQADSGGEVNGSHVVPVCYRKAMADFVHLHLHTLYSLLDGAIRMPDLVKTVGEKTLSAVAVTDHGNMFGAVDFYKRAKDAGIKPIFGCEAYVAGPRGRKDRTERVSNHLVLLAENEEGWRNLRYLVSMGYTEGHYYHPRIDKELLRKHSRGIFALTACLGGEVPG